MPTPTGPSFFVEPYNVVFAPTLNGSALPTQALFGIKTITFDRNENVLKGRDNLKLRPVAAHVIGIDDTVTIESEDLYPLEQLMSNTGPGQLTFSYRAAAHNSVGANQLPDQTVQITGIVFQKKTLTAPVGFGTYRLSGFCMEASGGDGVEVISFANTSSPPSDTPN